MQRRSNIKFNSAGLAGCASLCCLLFVSIGLAVPLSTSSAYADETNEQNNEYDIETYADDKEYQTSEVTISLTPNGTVNAPAVTPIDNTGLTSHVEVGANIKVESSNGYKVYIGSSSQYLKKDGTSNTDVINPIDKADGYKYTSIPENQWGYTTYNGKTDSFNAETATYYPMPTSVRGEPFHTVPANSLTNGTNGESGQDYTIGFAANINGNIPAGKYSNTVTLSVISDPKEVAEAHNDFDITTMQEMNNKDGQSKNACARAEIGATGQLKDERDGKYYWVTKLRDGNCWMTQNLDLDIKTSDGKLGDNTALQDGVWPDADKSDYDSAPDIKIYATSTRVIRGTTTSSSSPYIASWSLGDYRMNYTNTTVRDNGADCGNGKADASECTTVDSDGAANPAFVAYTTPTFANGETDAHYILGNHYQWTVATANTTDGTASICPKGWKLPTSNSTTEPGSFGKLITPGGSNDQADITTASVLVQDPYYFVRGGFIIQDTRQLNGAGAIGYYLSSTPYGGNAYSLGFGGDNYIDPSHASSQHDGMSVRCIAR